MESNKKMRIISGRFKGKPITFVKSLNTRPLKDSVKENIFNIISHSKLIKVELNNSTILDLYSGIGSFGLEALSRGAKKVTFVEKDKKALNILKKYVPNKNLKQCKSVLRAAALTYLAQSIISIFRLKIILLSFINIFKSFIKR